MTDCCQIRWNGYFDRIYVLHYAGHAAREEKLYRELSRVGIADSGILQVHENIQTPLYRHIKQHISCDREHLECDKTFSACFGHYFIIKMAQMRGYKRILVMENDVVFRKDVGQIKDVLDRMPADADVCMLSHFQSPCVENRQDIDVYLSEMTAARQRNAVYIRYDENSAKLGSCGAYFLSEKAITALAGLYEHCFELPDMIFREAPYHFREKRDPFHAYVLKTLSKYYSRTPICMQKLSEDSISVSNIPSFGKIYEMQNNIMKLAGVDPDDFES